jgi:hypothetical protein
VGVLTIAYREQEVGVFVRFRIATASECGGILEFYQVMKKRLF